MMIMAMLIWVINSRGTVISTGNVDLSVSGTVRSVGNTNVGTLVWLTQLASWTRGKSRPSLTGLGSSTVTLDLMINMCSVRGH